MRTFRCVGAAALAVGLALALSPWSRSEEPTRIQTIAVATFAHAPGEACVAHRVADLASESLARRVGKDWAVLARTQVLQRERGVAVPGTMTDAQLPEFATRLSATVAVGGKVEGGKVTLVVYDMRTGAKSTLGAVAAEPAKAADALAKKLGVTAADPGAEASVGFPEGKGCEAFAKARGGFDRDSKKGLQEGLKLAEAALAAAPKNARVQAHAAQARIRNRKVDEGLALADAARQAAPGLADTHFSYGLGYDYKNVFSKAVAAYETVASMDRGYGAARANLGLVLLRSGNLGKAIEALEQALALDQGSDAARVNLAIGAIAAGDGALAMRTLEPVRADSTFADLVRLTKGQALIRMGRSTQAIGLLSMLVAKEGRLGEEARYETALAHLQEGEVEKATPLFQAIAENSKNPRTRVRAGVGVARTALAKKDLEGAKGIFEWLEGKGVKSRLLGAAKALMKAQTKDVKGALADFSKVLAKRSHDHEAWFNYAVLLHREGMLEQAADGYLKAIASNPRAYWAHFNLGLLRMQETKYEAAAKALEAAAKGNPRAGDIANALGVAYAHSGKRAEAVKVWADYTKRAKAARPGWPIPAELTANLKALEALTAGGGK